MAIHVGPRLLSVFQQVSVGVHGSSAADQKGYKGFLFGLRQTDKTRGVPTSRVAVDSSVIRLDPIHPRYQITQDSLFSLSHSGRLPSVRSDVTHGAAQLSQAGCSLNLNHVWPKIYELIP